ncbi:MAG: DUF1080 domain-containing protein [Planctomycetota bacterium]
MKLTSILALLSLPATLLLQEDKLGYQDTPLIPGTMWHVHDGLRPQPTVVTPGAKLGAPPSDAIVLFDGSSTDAWNGGPWNIEGDAMVVNGKGGIETKQQFGDCQLHIEWRAPKPEGNGQHRGNSGVFFFGRYEVQILDCFGNQTYPDGMTAALYGQQPPMVNACRAPGEWQTYDIAFKAPRFDDAGALVSPGLVTVFHNGVLVHHAEPLIGATQHRNVATYSAHGERGPIGLQDHGNPMAFRNIWVRELERAK